MPNKPRSRHCINCGITFGYTPRSSCDPDNGRLYCSRKCTLTYQRAARANRLTPRQKELAAMPASQPNEGNAHWQAPHNAEGQTLRQHYLQQGNKGQLD